MLDVQEYVVKDLSIMTHLKFANLVSLAISRMFQVRGSVKSVQMVRQLGQWDQYSVKVYTYCLYFVILHTIFLKISI